MNFDYSKRHNNTTRINTPITIIVIAVISLIIYYSLSIFIVPQLYFLSSSEVKPQPIITATKLSASKVVLGESFDLTIIATNKEILQICNLFPCLFLILLL
jgi:type II secretory pathway component PulF